VGSRAQRRTRSTRSTSPDRSGCRGAWDQGRETAVPDERRRRPGRRIILSCVTHLESRKQRFRCGAAYRRDRQSSAVTSDKIGAAVQSSESVSTAAPGCWVWIESNAIASTTPWPLEPRTC
jgi:hypothetical protein